MAGSVRPGGRGSRMPLLGASTRRFRNADREHALQWVFSRPASMAQWRLSLGIGPPSLGERARDPGSGLITVALCMQIQASEFVKMLLHQAHRLSTWESSRPWAAFRAKRCANHGTAHTVFTGCLLLKR